MWCCTLREAKQRCSSPEFSEWMAWYSIDPWGEQRADLRMAISTAHILNCWRARKAAPIKPEQLMPFPLDGKKSGTIESRKGMMSVLKGFAAQFGKVVNPRAAAKKPAGSVESVTSVASPAGVREVQSDGDNGECGARDTGDGGG